ncbi:MAG: DNA recombination protein RmuC [Crocinitomicaceae bacterium]|nr:DNA recombination protein RmuC [Crocinitomicaceae bacterium]
MDYILLVIGLIVGGIIGYLTARLLSLDASEAQQRIKELEIEQATLLNTNTRLEQLLNESKNDLSFSQEAHRIELTNATEWKSKHSAIQDKLENQKEEINYLQAKFSKDFEIVASKILEEKSNKFTTQNKKNIDALLSPLKERIGEFQKKVEDTNEKNIERSATLDKHLEMLQKLNQEITSETKSLTQALRGDSKTQGNWGEMHLETILEKAGLQKDIHFTKETNLKSEDGNNQRLDYILNLPDGKRLILDSKVSLTAYSNYFDKEDDAHRTLYLRRHIDSVMNHITLLSKKDYQNLYDINTPDYVLMFVANEPALTLALKEDQNLFEKALDKNIVLVSTSTLLATLRTISYIWKQDLQNKNAEEIARQAGSLYDKFVNFSTDLIKIGTQLKTVTGTYEDTIKKLSEGKDNLVRKTERLKELGVNPSKSIDQRLIDRSDK